MAVTVNRRHLLAAAMLSIGCAATHAMAATARPSMARVIIDNDFSGDPDGLVQLAHHLLSRSVKIPLIVGSHLPVQFGGPASATAAVGEADALLKVMRLEKSHIMVAGAETSIPARSGWKPSPATAAIVREAMRDDAREPLFYAAGAGLTELALAWLAEPRIGKRIKLVWIGGREHEGMAYPPPGRDEDEFNFSLDPLAAQIIFNESDIEIWQVPRDAYRRMLYSSAEMNELAMSGPTGRYLQQKMDGVADMLAKIPGFPPMPDAETFILGDSPLVTLTALMAPIAPDPSSSSYAVKSTPRLDAHGRYKATADGRPMRVYTMIDAGLTFRDMGSKFRALGVSKP